MNASSWLRKEKSSLKITFTLCLTIFIAFFIFIENAVAQNTTNQFNYGQVNDDPNFIYQAPADNDNYPVTSERKVNNVILFIGDGMGPAQVTLARISAAGPDGKLHMQKMPFTGTLKTHSADKLVTDSAAAGTALASGYKTSNGMLNINSARKAR